MAEDSNIKDIGLSASSPLFAEIRQILINARKTAYKAVNFAMVTAYWNIGRLIVEDEQQGSTRAEYGKAVLADLSVRLTEEFGKGFDERELRRIRQFYLTFPKWDALRPELTWTHYRLLIRVQDALGLILCSDKNEAVVKYSVLAEHRQIFASKYLLELPAPEMLQREIMRERKQLEG